MHIETYDNNGWYSMKVEKCQWENSDKELQDSISIELNNIDDDELPKYAKIPDETTFIMTLEDAKYLKAFLDVALNGA